MVELTLHGGDWEAKFRVFHFDLKTFKGTLDGTKLHFDPKLHYRKAFELGNVGALAVDVDNNVAKVMLMLGSFPVFVQSFDLNDLLKGKKLAVHGFNQFGLKLSNLELTAALV